MMHLHASRMSPEFECELYFQQEIVYFQQDKKRRSPRVNSAHPKRWMKGSLSKVLLLFQPRIKTPKQGNTESEFKRVTTLLNT
jgi:hypothetical protein